MKGDMGGFGEGESGGGGRGGGLVGGIRCIGVEKNIIEEGE